MTALESTLNVSEIAKALRISRPTIQMWCRKGKLPVAKIGKEYRIRQSDLENWYEGRKRIAKV